MPTWKIRVPASSANLGPGFDILGLALDCPLTVTVTPSPDFQLEVTGEGSDQVPTDAEHLIVATAREIAGESALQYHWKIDSQIPMTRGLGSSAAAIGAGLTAGFLFRDGTISQRSELFRELTSREGHGDNAAAAVYGGLQFCFQEKANLISCQSVPCPESLGVIALVPEHELATAQARAALPDTHETTAVTSNMAALSLLLRSLESHDTRQLSKACTDSLHEPYRLPLVPGLEEALAALRSDEHLMGSWLSGAGPTLASFAPLSAFPDLIHGQGLSSATAALKQAGIETTILGLAVDHQGIQWEKLQ